MRNRLLGWIFAAALSLVPAAASAQTAPNWTFNYVPTTAQWNAIFASKQDVLGYVPMNVAGGSFTGRVVTPAPGASTSGFNLTPGSSPASPANGDLWTTSSGLFVRINGATVGPLGSTGANTYTDTQTINPPTGTLHQGLVINQTGPTSGSSVGPWSGSIINSSFGATVTGSSDPFFDNGAWQTWVAAHRVNFTVGGSNLGGEPVGAGFYQLIANTNAVGASDGDFIGLAGEAWANATITNGAFHGLVGAAIMGASSNVRTINGLFAEADILTGGVAAARRGINIVSQGNVTATGASDTAINVATSNSATGFKNLIIIDTAGGTIQPIQSTGDILKSDGAFTVANVLNLPSATVTSKIMNFANYTVSGAGVLKAGAGTADANTGAMVNAAVASGGVAALISQANSSTGFNGFHTNNSTGLASLFAVVGEPSSTQTIFGQANANWGEVVSSGPSNNGLLLGALTNSPILLGTNNTARMQITGAGLVGIGSTVTPDSTLTVNNNTGSTVAAGVANDLHLVAPNTSNGGVLSDVFNGEVAFIGRVSGGTLASKSAVGAGVSITAFAAQTWDGSAYASNSVLEYQTINLQSGSDHSSKARLRLVPSGSTTLTDVMLWGPGVVIGSGGTDQGAGTLNVTSNYYIGGTLLKNVAETLTNKTISGASNTLSNVATTSLTGTLQAAQEPAHTGDVTNSAGSLAMTLATAQPSVHTWALAQTFTVAPVFTDASGSRTALGLGTMSTQAASAVAITGGTINGTVIGGSTPAAITGTTITANTSFSSANGSSAGLFFQASGGAADAQIFEGSGGALNVKMGTVNALNITTNGSGSVLDYGVTAAGKLTVSGLGVGTVGADSLLTVNANTGATVAIAAGTNLHIVGADAANNIQTFDTYGGQAIFAARRANGTLASKTGLVNGNNIFNININGWDTAAYNTSASIIAVAAETWSASAHGTYFDFNTTPLTTIATALAMRIYGSGGVSVGSTAFDAGLGKINAQNGYTVGGTSGLSATKTVRASGGASDCTLIYTGGILTGGSC